MKEIVKVQCIKYQYPDKTRVSICGINFIVHPKEKVALIGANGAGKSTLLFHLAGLLKPMEGKVEVFGVDPFEKFKDIGKRIGIVVQNVEDQLIGPTVFDDIAFSLINYGVGKKEVERRVKEITKELKIEYLQDRIVHYLSGGEKKRVALAGALVLKPELLILDEALAELDTEAVELNLKKIDELSKKYNAAIIMATNDMEVVHKFADIIYLLDAGLITFKGSFQELLKYEKKYELCKH